MFKYTQKKTLINGLTTIFNCILLWNTSIWHNDMFYVHNHLLKTTTTTSDIRELSSPRLVQSASWLVRELSSPLVDQSASWQSASWHIREVSSYHLDCTLCSWRRATLQGGSGGTIIGRGLGSTCTTGWAKKRGHLDFLNSSVKN